MKQFYRYDAEGYYLPGQDYLAECAEEGSTEVAPVTEEGKGLYKARNVGGAWIEEGKAPATLPQEPTAEDRLAALEMAMLDLMMF